MEKKKEKKPLTGSQGQSCAPRKGAEGFDWGKMKQMTFDDLKAPPEAAKGGQTSSPLGTTGLTDTSSTPFDEWRWKEGLKREADFIRAWMNLLENLRQKECLQ